MHPERPSFLGRAAAARLVALLLALSSGGPGWPTILRAQEPEVTDDSVEAAIRRAANWIESQRNSQGHWQASNNTADRHWAGTSALALLSLLYAGRDAREEAMDRSLTWVAAQALNGTYTYGTRAHVLALVPGKKFSTRLQEDLGWLLTAIGAKGTEAAGAYDYGAAEEGKLSRWDNSATQYGVLGVWMAADAGLSVPDAYWENVGQHWMTWQNPDGGWGYQNHDGSTGSMTAAGLGCLFVVLDQRYADRPKEAGGLLSAIDRGLDWLGREYGPENPHGNREWHYYYLYGVERVGRASGYKYFRDKDWFRDGAAYLLRGQRPEGCWTGSGEGAIHNAAWGLMFLCHGRAPLLFNKLQHGSDWDGKLRDVAGLTRYAGHTFERLLNWQIVRLDGTIDDLLEAPVLYLYGESKPEFSDVEVEKIREFCQRGGLLFGLAGKDSNQFCQGFEALARRAFPEYPLRPVEREHPLFTGEVQFPINDPPRMLQVHNGVRMLMLLSTRDLASAWNKYAVRGRLEQDFQLAANVYLYATDKSTIRSRLQTPAIPLRKTTITRTIRVARIKYSGKWDVEPYGWTRLHHYMNNEAATNLLVTSGVTFDSEDLKNFNLAHITGTQSFELSPEEARGLRQFLSGGGTLLADAAGGSLDFTRSLEDQVRQAIREEPRSLPPDSCILTGTGIPDAVDLAGTGYRRAARGAAGGQKYPRLKVFPSRRRYAVIYSPLDLTTALLGTQVYNVQGYDPPSGLQIMRNLLVYGDLSSADKARLERGGQ
jgi:hypothetical protein